MERSKVKKPSSGFCVIRGSWGEGIVIYGPFATSQDARDFEEFFCSDSCSESFELIDPKKARSSESSKWRWSEILKEAPARRKMSMQEIKQNEYTFWTRKDGMDYEADVVTHRRQGLVRKCGKCSKGVIAHGNSLLRSHCLVCGGDTVKLVAGKRIARVK